MTAKINHPNLWRAQLPVPQPNGNKYDRGFVGIFAAPELTGATRLASTACNRIGAGLVSVVALERADVYRTCLPPDLMVTDKFPPKANVALGGSGGISNSHFDQLLDASHLSGRIFDADALPPHLAFDRLDDTCILTPHRGEFERVFGPVGGDFEQAAHRAASNSGANVVLKSAQTVIASPAGELVCNHHASPYLAKAGTGDVLAGLIAGLVAQGMNAYGACCAAVWIHGEAALRFGPGLIASDLEGLVPSILSELISPTS